MFGVWILIGDPLMNIIKVHQPFGRQFLIQIQLAIWDFRIQGPILAGEHNLSVISMWVIVIASFRRRCFGMTKHPKVRQQLPSCSAFLGLLSFFGAPFTSVNRMPRLRRSMRIVKCALKFATN